MGAQLAFPATRIAKTGVAGFLAAAAILSGCVPERLPAAPPAPVDAPSGPVPATGPGGAFVTGPFASPGSPADPLPGNGGNTTVTLADDPSPGGTITFQGMGAPGWYPSRRDPAGGNCDAWNRDGCCLARHEPAGRLAPWDEELILTLRGPVDLRALAVWQPDSGAPAGAPWKRTGRWERGVAGRAGLAFAGDGAAEFDGRVGNKCLVDVATDRPFPCGPASVPYCPSSTSAPRRGWSGSKLILLSAAMPRFGDPALAGTRHCSADPGDAWFDAPWIGLSHGELIRSGKFGNCHCYSKDPSQWWLADGCGQFNVFEVVNDNNAFRNLQLFSTNFFAYHGYIGEGPCGDRCDTAAFPPAADLIDKATSRAAQAGATAGPGKGPGAAFRRPTAGPRWFLILLDAETRTIQLGLVHPDRAAAAMPEAAGLPAELTRAAIDALLALRLPAGIPSSIRRE